MNDRWNPEIPLDIQQQFTREKEQAFTLYLDFVVDGTASMYTIYPAVYYAAAHFWNACPNTRFIPWWDSPSSEMNRWAKRQSG